MSRLTSEQYLIDGFVTALRAHTDPNLRLNELINDNCRARNFADVEFKSESKIHWVIEAKSDESGDRHNSAHKIFGEILKETGRTNRQDCMHAVLIATNAVHFYSKKFQCIDREKFVGFGNLIPIDTVFTCETGVIQQLTWCGLYDAYAVDVP
jgi:hypothetical protein